MNITRTSPIDWRGSMERLSIGAFYLLNVLYRYDIEVSDEKLMAITNIGLSTHRKHKRELVDTGYLSIAQVGRGRYHYTIGESNGS